MSYHDQPLGCTLIRVSYCPTDIDDLFDAKRELQPQIIRWKHIGLALRLDPNQLKKIEVENRGLDDCLIEMLTLWLNKNYNTERFGEPSWELLAKAVGDPAGGNNSRLADEIRQRHSKHTLYICSLCHFANNCSSNRPI